MARRQHSGFAMHTSAIAVYMRVRTHAHIDARPPQRAAIRRAVLSPRPLARTQLHCTPARCAACVKSAHKRCGARRGGGEHSPRPAAFLPQTVTARRSREHTAPTRRAYTLVYSRETTPNVLRTLLSAVLNYSHELY